MYVLTSLKPFKTRLISTVHYGLYHVSFKHTLYIQCRVGKVYEPLKIPKGDLKNLRRPTIKNCLHA